MTFYFSINKKTPIKLIVYVSRMSNGATTTASFTIRERPSNSQSSSAAASTNGEATCAVCGDGCAKLHYGVLACYGK